MCIIIIMIIIIITTITHLSGQSPTPGCSLLVFASRKWHKWFRSIRDAAGEAELSNGMNIYMCVCMCVEEDRYMRLCMSSLRAIYTGRLRCGGCGDDYEYQAKRRAMMNASPSSCDIYITANPCPRSRDWHTTRSANNRTHT